MPLLDPAPALSADLDLPQVNATLVRVQSAGGAAGGGESYDGPAAPGEAPEKWSSGPGQQPNAYLRERRLPRESAEGRDIILDRVLLVASSAPNVEWLVGDVVTYVTLGASDPTVATVQIVQRPAIADPEIPADLQTVRLTLEPA